MVKQYRYLDTDVYCREGKISQLRLLQSTNRRTFPLSQFFSNEGKVVCAINASFFNTKGEIFVLGRCQGDEYQATYNDKESYKYCDFVVQGDEVKIGRFGSGDYSKSVCGYSPLAILMNNGEDCEIYSELIPDAVSITKSVNPRTAVVITKDNRVVFVKNDGRNSTDKGLTGFELRKFLKTKYDIKNLVINDGGGSAELIEDKKIYGELSDGHERPMLDALVMLEDTDPSDPKDEKIKELEEQIVTIKGKVNTAIDILEDAVKVNNNGTC